MYIVETYKIFSEHTWCRIHQHPSLSIIVSFISPLFHPSSWYCRQTFSSQGGIIANIVNHNDTKIQRRFFVCSYSSASYLQQWLARWNSLLSPTSCSPQPLEFMCYDVHARGQSVHKSFWHFSQEEMGNGPRDWLLSFRSTQLTRRELERLEMEDLDDETLMKGECNYSPSP